MLGGDKKKFIAIIWRPQPQPITILLLRMENSIKPRLVNSHFSALFNIYRACAWRISLLFRVRVGESFVVQQWSLRHVIVGLLRGCVVCF